MKITETPGEANPCPSCGAQVPRNVLVCPACGALMRAAELKQLSSQATAAEQSGDLATSLATWRDVLNLLPLASRQHATVLEKVNALTKRVDAGASKPAAAAQIGKAAGIIATGSTLASPPPPPHTAPSATPSAPHAHASPQEKTGIAAVLSILAAILLKSKGLLILLLTKGKILLLGLTKASTFFSMFLSFGVYWSVWGWKFAAGLVVSIYIHEMGHVVALRKFGIRATAPMFIPGLGAFIRLKDYPHDPRADARTGLAGPIYGLGAAVAAYAVYLATGSAAWGAIAKMGAWINLFNLIPIYPLDGGHGFRALVRWQRLAVAAIAGTMWAAPMMITNGRHGDGMLAIIGLVAVFRSFTPTDVTEPDHRTLNEFGVLLIALGTLAAIHIPHSTL